MNWISFAERRPKAEPKRQILLKGHLGFVVTWMSTDANPQPGGFTHWAEIEGPDTDPVQIALHKVRVASELLMKQWAEPTPEPPKPDPLEEAWMKHQLADFVESESGNNPWRFHFKAGWDAAMKFKEGK